MRDIRMMIRRESLGQFQTPNSTGSRTVPHDNFTEQKTEDLWNVFHDVKANYMPSTSHKNFCSWEEKRNFKLPQISHTKRSGCFPIRSPKIAKAWGHSRRKFQQQKKKKDWRNEHNRLSQREHNFIIAHSSTSTNKEKKTMQSIVILSYEKPAPLLQGQESVFLGSVWPARRYQRRCHRTSFSVQVVERRDGLVRWEYFDAQTVRLHPRQDILQQDTSRSSPKLGQRRWRRRIYDASQESSSLLSVDIHVNRLLKAFTHLKWTADPRDHFKDTIGMHVTISNPPTLTGVNLFSVKMPSIED